LDDIEVDAWEESHHDLDLTVPLAISAEQAAQGGSFEVRCSRSIVEGVAKRREPVCCMILVPAGAQDGSLIITAGLGDCADERRGDLKVIVRVKRP
jgi:hypothetical protein